MMGCWGLVHWLQAPQWKGKSTHMDNNKLGVETWNIFIKLFQEHLNCGSTNVFLPHLHIGTFFVLIRKLIADLSCYHGNLNISLSLKRKNTCLSTSFTSSEIIRKINHRPKGVLDTIWSKPFTSQRRKTGLWDLSISGWINDIYWWINDICLDQLSWLQQMVFVPHHWTSCFLSWWDHLPGRCL